MRVEPSQVLPRKALPLWRWQAFFESLFVAIFPLVYGILLYFFEMPFWILWLLIASYIGYASVTVLVLPPIKWRRWHYDVYSNEIDLKRGVFIVKRTLIPMARVQHVDTEQGPLARKYNLATVSISTAATVHHIPSLTMEVADELRDRIAELAAVAEDE
ncbi:PH domain-containing protein [Halalkalibacter krulwichiae]|uniref:Bacterial membrane flanked domain protein n=1 Tax=Halalkalibacter krulwichiae TaxID=199441 RepID=A0A1X9MFS3_9BACI|nr:PH domain-containing protein [Halalkalibacter krulwichiae]ARK30371.1 Bacterial membrane flanked domain protein [Halalkalibacter krulwichiae]